MASSEIHGAGLSPPSRGRGLHPGGAATPGLACRHTTVTARPRSSDAPSRPASAASDLLLVVVVEAHSFVCDRSSCWRRGGRMRRVPRAPDRRSRSWPAGLCRLRPPETRGERPIEFRNTTGSRWRTPRFGTPPSSGPSSPRSTSPPSRSRSPERARHPTRTRSTGRRSPPRHFARSPTANDSRRQHRRPTRRQGPPARRSASSSPEPPRRSPRQRTRGPTRSEATGDRQTPQAPKPL